MYSNIQHLFAKHGAVYDQGSNRVLVEGSNSLADSDGKDFMLTPQFVLLRIAGEDAQTFLQSQVSSDVRELVDGKVQLSSYSNAKGRMQASFVLWNDGNAFFAILHESLQERLVKRLRMFVMRSRVQIEVVSQARLAVSSTIVGAPFHYRASALFEIHIENGLGFLCDFDGGEGFANAQGNMFGSDVADLLFIKAGICWVSDPTFEAFVPQMMNLDVLGGISFKKGCYPGQEIVARTQYLGKVKRRLFRVSADHAVSPGDAVFSVDSPDQSVGMVAMSFVRNGIIEALVVMQIAAWESSPYVKNGTGGLIHINKLDLPYSVPDL